MAYIKEHTDGTSTVFPHKNRIMLKNRITQLLQTYSIDDVLCEMADQRPTFDILIRVAKPEQVGAK